MVFCQKNYLYTIGGPIMVDEITSFVNWLRRRNPHARTWKDYRYVLARFHNAIGDKRPALCPVKPRLVMSVWSPEGSSRYPPKG